MDAYVYVRTEPTMARKAAEAIAGMEAVRQVTVVTGEWDIVVAIEGIDPTELGPTVIEDIQAAPGVVQTSTAPVVPLEEAMELRYPTRGPKPPYPTRGLTSITALVNILVAPGMGIDVVRALADNERVYGVALLAGEIDVLAEIGGATWEEVAQLILDEIQTIEGIESTSTSIAVFPKFKESQAD